MQESGRSDDGEGHHIDDRRDVDGDADNTGGHRPYLGWEELALKPLSLMLVQNKRDIFVNDHTFQDV